MPQVWLVTGSARGLGRALCDAVLSAGHSMVATARRHELLADLPEKYGSHVRTVALDVTDRAGADMAIDLAIEAFGHLDVLVNNEGYGDIGWIEEMSNAAFRAQLEVNLFGVINMTRAVLPVMREQGWGRIIQISSAGGRRGTPGLAAYQTAKCGVDAFSEVLAREVAPQIHVTIVEPGSFRTDCLSPLALGPHDCHGLQPGDPEKAAAVILQVANLEAPPLRLLLGSDAVQFSEQADRARNESDRKWRHVSLSTDFVAGDAGVPVLHPWDRSH